MVICLERGADLHLAQLMPLPLTVSCFSKIRIGSTYPVPAHLGSPGKRAVKWTCVCFSLTHAPRAGANYIQGGDTEVSCTALFRTHLLGVVIHTIDVKNVFTFFFILVTFLTFFYFPIVFYFKKMLAKFRPASRLTRSTLKITATK